MKAFDGAYTEQDYKFASKLLYPELYPFLSTVAEDGPKEDYDIWQQILLSLIDYKTFLGLSEDRLSTIKTSNSLEENIDAIRKLLTGALSISKNTLYKVLEKLLVKLEYPYFYSQIKGIYKLNDYVKDNFDFREGGQVYPGLINYLKSGDICIYNLTVIGLLLRDGLHSDSIGDFPEF